MPSDPPVRRPHLQRVQRRRAKGWRVPPNTVYVGRGSKWGNPFVVGQDGTRDECLTLYTALVCGLLNISKSAAHVRQQEATLKAVRTAKHELKGKRLMCWCRLDQACHADVLAEIAHGDGVSAKTIKARLRGFQVVG